MILFFRSYAHNFFISSLQTLLYSTIKYIYQQTRLGHFKIFRFKKHVGIAVPQEIVFTARLHIHLPSLQCNKKIAR